MVVYECPKKKHFKLLAIIFLLFSVGIRHIRWNQKPWHALLKECDHTIFHKESYFLEHEMDNIFSHILHIKIHQPKASTLHYWFSRNTRAWENVPSKFNNISSSTPVITIMFLYAFVISTFPSNIWANWTC